VKAIRDDPVDLRLRAGDHRDVRARRDGRIHRDDPRARAVALHRRERRKIGLRCECIGAETVEGQQNDTRGRAGGGELRRG
jgi:hypothetical protein